MSVEVPWKSVPLTLKELSLSRVLRCGQAFRWKNVDEVWSFSSKTQVILLRQDETHLYYASVLKSDAKNEKRHEMAHNFIHDYFNLDVKLESLYKAWSKVESRFLKSSETASFVSFPGIRMLRQEPWETVVSFICSSNNNVKRISKMCDSLCTEYGTFINDYDGVSYFSFPSPEALAGPKVETRLRELGFGYRAKYIHQTAKMFVDDLYPHISLESLYGLRSKTYEEAHAFLLQLAGVGPKVADCICLMALDKHDVVPVDTHVWQIAVKHYKFNGPKTITQKAYHDVRQHLQGLFGQYAGWAQSVMFTADLSDLNNGLNKIQGKVVKHQIMTERNVDILVKVKMRTDKAMSPEFKPKISLGGNPETNLKGKVKRKRDDSETKSLKRVTTAD